jgi:hypothetical protein
MISSYQDNSFTIRESILPSIILTFSEKLNGTPQLFGAEFKKDPNDDKRILSVRNDIIDIFESFNLTNSITYKSNGNVDVVVKKPEIMKLLIKVELSNSVINIKERAFAHWENLAEIIIPNSVTSIGESAFAHSGLRSIIIPNSVMYLGNHNYLGLDRTDDPPFHLSKSPLLGKNVTFMDKRVKRYGYVTKDGRFKYNAFSNDKFNPIDFNKYPLTNAIIKEIDDKNYIAIKEVSRRIDKFNKDDFDTFVITNTIVNGNFIENLIIKRRYDEGGIFYNTPHLHTVIFETGSKIINIPTGTFSNCISLTNLTLPEFLINIDYRAFYNCNSLSFINFPNTLMVIGTKAFYSSRLTTITIPKSVVFIHTKAFMNSIMLSEVNFESESNLETIGHEAFRGTGIRSITIPNTVKILGEIYYLTEENYDEHKNNGGVFSDCRFLENVTFEEGSEIMSINPFSFSNCVSLQTVKLPSKLDSIEPFAFNNCNSLMSITIPKTVNYISGFNGCSKLENVIFEPFYYIVVALKTIGWMAFANSGIKKMDLRNLKNLKTVHDNAFLECSELVTILFPLSLEIICNRALKTCKKLKNITMSFNAYKGITQLGGPVKREFREYIIMPGAMGAGEAYTKILSTIDSISYLGLPIMNGLYNKALLVEGVELIFTLLSGDPLVGRIAGTLVRLAMVVKFGPQAQSMFLSNMAINSMKNWRAIETYFKSRRPQAGLDDEVYRSILVKETETGPYLRVMFIGAGGFMLFKDKPIYTLPF